MSLAWSSVKALSIPVGGTSRDVKRVTAGGVTLWEKPNQNPYVSDGLIAWYDGLWNAGVGTHDSTSTKLHNLVDGSEINIAQYMGYSSTALTISNDRCLGVVTDIGSDSVSCIEIAYTATRYTSPTFLIFGKTPKCIIPYGNGEFLLSNNSRAITGGPSSLAVCASVNYNSSGATSATMNGTVYQISSSSRNISAPSFSNNIRIGGRYAGNLAFVGGIHCIRLYSRTLTDAEVAANYAVDKERFGLP